LSKLAIQIAAENLGSFSNGTRRPLFWFCQKQKFFPVSNLRNDFEGFGEFSTFVGS
jgi:hypothetical protein